MEKWKREMDRKGEEGRSGEGDEGSLAFYK